MIKKTPFYDFHVKNGGKIVEFAGFYMPVQFEGIVEEHNTVRNNAGLFDVSHMGEVEIRGPDRIQFANFITTNNVSKLALNQVQYSCMLYPDAGIVDDLLVYNLKDRILLVINASNIDKDYEWIVENQRFEVEIKNRSDEIGQLAIQGPNAEQVVKKFVDLDLSNLKYYWAEETGIMGHPITLSRTGYTGEDGFEIYLDRSDADSIWETVFNAGTDLGMKPIGLGARDTLRLEMRFCLYGNDIDKTTNPFEAGLGWIVKLEKEDFIGRDSLIKIKEAGPKRKLVGFVAVSNGIPRPHQDIQVNGNAIGLVTSGTFSPSVKKGIGLGYVENGHDVIGKVLQVTGKTAFDVEIIKGAFYKNPSHK